MFGSLASIISIMATIVGTIYALRQYQSALMSKRQDYDAEFSRIVTKALDHYEHSDRYRNQYKEWRKCYDSDDRNTRTIMMMVESTQFERMYGQDATLELRSRLKWKHDDLESKGKNPNDYAYVFEFCSEFLDDTDVCNRMKRNKRYIFNAKARSDAQQ